MSEKFDWKNDEDAVFLREQPATAVYVNTLGQIVLQQKSAHGDDDNVVFIASQCLPVLIKKLVEIAKAS